MKLVFADTSYWIALLNPRDDLHRENVAAARSHCTDRVVTSEVILVEFLNAFR
jgi:predicted nucleic acid-binding protein